MSEPCAARGSARIGIFGGTFNPIHQGHLRSAEEVAEALELDRVLFIPSARPPHKDATEVEVIAPARERLAWVEQAVSDNPRFEVDTVEVERSGPSYLVDTLRAIGASCAPELPVFIVGHDAFVEIGSWREPETLFTLAHFAVTTRPPVERGSLGDWLPECVRGEIQVAEDGRSARHRRAGTWIRLVEITALAVSASDIRTRIREGYSVRYLLPDKVREAVLASGCYAARPPLGQPAREKVK
ncbi:MAG: nicotinate (nicotinamide) nucleotide adenylyltransferase [Deltaproteobacteria bacterium]|nr:nicotinate (nicotinamide) nucleotide adenylyltransferase [Deltaproteobacteria bacterium]MBW2417119.1 nicotinate (nicotinamide) nucleotide adenylyltransferase [Deltaproteobacteria bacterium]